jgi:hypothetical protein
MAVSRVAVNATDPSVDGGLLVWHEAGAAGVLVNGGARTRLAGSHPAVGGGRLAVLRGDVIDVGHTSGAPFAVTVPAPGADAVAVSAQWLVWRSGNTILTAPLAGGPPRAVMTAAGIGRPALDGDRLAFHVAGPSGGRIVAGDLRTLSLSTVRRERRALLLNPSLLGEELLYVRAVMSRQELRLGPLARRAPRRDRVVWSTVPTGRRDTGHEPGARHHRHGHPRRLWRRPPEGVSATLWTTALAVDGAYVTRLHQATGDPLVAELLRIPR